MNDTQLDRSISSIGKSCFVEYFEMFSNKAISNEDAVDMVMKNENYEESGAKTRVSQSRHTISSGRAKDALIIIATSQRVPKTVSDKAADLALVAE